jgi:hypothetical protein
MAEIAHAKGQSSAAEGQSWLCPKARQRTAPKRRAAILLVDDEKPFAHYDAISCQKWDSMRWRYRPVSK